LPAAADNDVVARSIFSGAGVFEITIMNGRAEFGAAPAGVSIRTGDAPLGALSARQPLANLALAFSEETLLIDIEGVVAQPILLRRIAGAGETHHRAIINLAPGAEATIIESFDGAGAFFSNSVTDHALGAGATLNRYVIQNAGEAGVETALSTAVLQQEAQFNQVTLTLDGKLVRLESRILCKGRGAAVSIRSAAALSAARHADATSQVEFDAEECEARQIHRAALKDKSHGVFQGKFLVARGAQKTDAKMNAGALLLSGMAESDAKPELEIYADDVECAHGSTAGALDEGQVFYMRQRGLSNEAARALLIEAFLGEVFDGAGAENLKSILRARLARWLEARS